MEPSSSLLSFFSSLSGWIYTAAWSLSFYPQPLLNYRRRSTSGTTVDFPFLNSLGFLAYFSYTAAFLYSPLIRAQYAARHHGLAPTVQPNDLAFAAHALLLSCITTSQYHPTLWRFNSARAARHRPSRPISGIAFGCLLALAFTALRVIVASGPDLDPASDWCALDIVYAASYVKLVVTLVKYTPQVLANVRNRSTRGWSIWQILLDLTGGLLSVAQQAIDSYLQRDWSGITGNPVKFALGNVSLVYDAVFIFQHYFLYREERRKRSGGGGDEDAREPLLRRGDEEDRRID
ncbi:hypothetical protein jhhlp_008611 [Lomentospora prolificans]|uniref:Cystinosin n=1 Tax=Lomentospora prolificans TaxID=41688 RepID=A0A2N3MYJ2_9PEZI|nr:hypothetical protein jhhlp_008611 [Lomentospora prolificans]